VADLISGLEETEVRHAQEAENGYLQSKHPS
jgi:hypothetical protein